MFDRSTRKPTLIFDGQRVYQYAKAVLFQTSELDKVVISITKQEESIIKIGCDQAVFTAAFHHILSQFNKKFSHTQLELITASSSDVPSKIAEQKLDIGVVFTDLNFQNDIEPCFIGHLPFYAVCHPEHALVALYKVHVADLVSHKQLLQRDETGELIPQFPANVWWANSFDSLKVFLQQNIGWAYLPVHMVENDIKNASLYKLPVVIDHQTWSIPIDIIIPKAAIMGPAMRWLYAQLKQFYRLKKI